MTDIEKLERLKAHTTEHIPGFEIRFKGTKYKDDPWIRKIIDRVAPIFARDFNTTFATTIYPFVYVPNGWALHHRKLYDVLRHEYIHLRDEQKWGWWFKLSYVFILPFLWTMRAYWERRAYTQSLLVEYETRGSISPRMLDWVANQFSGYNYGWMDPWARRKIKRIAERIEAGEIRGLWPYEEDWSDVA